MRNLINTPPHLHSKRPVRREKKDDKKRKISVVDVTYTQFSSGKKTSHHVVPIHARYKTVIPREHLTMMGRDGGQASLRRSKGASCR